MSTYKKILSLLIVPAILLCIIFDCSNSIDLNVSAAETQIVHIFGTDVNVRSSKEVLSTNSLCKINHDVAELLSDEGEWLKIKYNNDGNEVIGYIKYNAGWIRKLTYNPDHRDPVFETQISAFPESYKQSLRLLHLLYPNWKFTPYNVDITLSQAVAMETTCTIYHVGTDNHKYLYHSYGDSWRSMDNGCYDWNTYGYVEKEKGGWTGASREIVEWYMEPRNFLNPYEIYMFLEQKYDSSKQTVDGLNNIIRGTFLEKPYTDIEYPNNDGNYTQAIMNAAEASKVSPYIIASKIIQEQGVDGSSALISGTHPVYNGYYNYFNIKAYGDDIVSNGLAYASIQKDPTWNTRAGAIIGGAKFLGNNYISAGQSTYYFQDYNMVNFNIHHQYATAVHDAYSKGVNIASGYGDKFNYPLEFTIPIYKNTTAAPTPKPANNNKKNNYYILSIDGLTPTFDKYKYDGYTLSVDDDAVLNVTVPDGASLTSNNEFHLGEGNNEVILTVKSETGYTNNYTINVNSTKTCTLFISSNGNSSGGTSTDYKLADVNNDGKITISDIGNIRLHLLGKYTLKDNSALAADVNKDGKITISDIGNIRLHLLGKYTIQ